VWLLDRVRKSVIARQRRSALKASGMTVEFSTTAASVKAYRGVIADRVAMIEGIPLKHMKAVQKAVWQAVMRGGDMHSLSVVLQEHGLSVRDAASVARYQCSMAKAIMDNTRRLELGITEAIWRHSGAGKNPRPSHMAFSGKRFNLATGAFLDGKWVWPGSEPDCLCTSKSVIPGFDED
jgi:uncharacterized protein with gpF-like domain